MRNTHTGQRYHVVASEIVLLFILKSPVSGRDRTPDPRNNRLAVTDKAINAG